MAGSSLDLTMQMACKSSLNTKNGFFRIESERSPILFASIKDLNTLRSPNTASLASAIHKTS